MGGTIDDTELVHGLVFDRGAKKTAGGPTRIENAKIGLIQFCLSAPKVRSPLHKKMKLLKSAVGKEGGGGEQRLVDEIHHQFEITSLRGV